VLAILCFGIVKRRAAAVRTPLPALPCLRCALAAKWRWLRRPKFEAGNGYPAQPTSSTAGFTILRKYLKSGRLLRRLWKHSRSRVPASPRPTKVCLRPMHDGSISFGRGQPGRLFHTATSLERQLHRRLQHARGRRADHVAEGGAAHVPVHRAGAGELRVVEDVERLHAKQQRS
jgi:hypothetical protein